MSDVEPTFPPIRAIPIRLIKPWRCISRTKRRKYAEAMRAGDQFPPIVLVRNWSRAGKNYRYRYRIVDGCHRAKAAELIGHETIAAYVVPSWKAVDGNERFWESVGARQIFPGMPA